jgi:Protein of unknown function (DUF2934)
MTDKARAATDSVWLMHRARRYTCAGNIRRRPSMAEDAAMAEPRNPNQTPSTKPTQPRRKTAPTVPPTDAVPAAPVREASPASPESTPITARNRHAMIATAAYYRAEKRRFASGFELEDWIAAEAEVDALLLRRGH